MVIGLWVDCWATTRLAHKHKTAAAKTRIRFIDECSEENENKKCRGESTTGIIAARAGGSDSSVRRALQKNLFDTAFFSCARVQTLYSFVASLIYRRVENRLRLRRTIVKIEQHIGSRPNSFPSTFHTEKESNEADALAVGCGDVFHGVWRDLWNGRSYSRRRLRPRNFDFAFFAGALVFADGIHDRRVVERAAARRRLLRVGSSRTRQLLGISGSVAVAGRQHIRHGDLSDALRDLFEADGSVVR